MGTGLDYWARFLIAGALIACAKPPPPVAPVVVRSTPVGPTRPILITVDDLPIASGGLHPDPESRAAITRGILDTFRKHGVKAVGFVTWRNVKSDADKALLQQWLDEGHELGNHTTNHRDLGRLPVDEYIADTEAARVEIARLTMRPVRFFRFTFLREGDTLEKLRSFRAYLERSGQRNIPPTLDTQDWSFEESYVKALRAGDPAKAAFTAQEFQASLRADILGQERLGDELFELRTPQNILLHANRIGADQWDALF